MTRGLPGGVIETMALARGPRFLSVLLMVVALTPAAKRGLCFMPVSETSPRVGHDCCRNGWSAAPPPCCMEGKVGEIPAIRAMKQEVVAAVSGATTAFVADGGRAWMDEPHTSPRAHTHSPPRKLVLRI